MKKFGPDFYDLTDLLTDEELLIQQTAFDFVKAEFMPVISKNYENGTFPMELIPKLGELGFMGSSLPEESGGAGVSNVAYGLILHELERGDSGLRSFASVQGSLVMYPIHAYGSDHQKAKWLPGLGAGNLIGCFGLTEPNFGSNPGGMTTRCKRDGDDWIINGQKVWTSGAHYSDFGILVVRHDPDVAKHKGLTFFFVDMKSPGITVKPIKQITGQAGSGSGFNEVYFDDVRIPDSQRLGEIGDGWKVAITTLMNERLAVGDARGSDIEEALILSKTKDDAGETLIKNDSVRERLADCLG